MKMIYIVEESVRTIKSLDEFYNGICLDTGCDREELNSYFDYKEGLKFLTETGTVIKKVTDKDGEPAYEVHEYALVGHKYDDKENKILYDKYVDEEQWSEGFFRVVDTTKDNAKVGGEFEKFADAQDYLAKEPEDIRKNLKIVFHSAKNEFVCD